VARSTRRTPLGRGRAGSRGAARQLGAPAPKLTRATSCVQPSIRGHRHRGFQCLTSVFAFWLVREARRSVQPGRGGSASASPARPAGPPRLSAGLCRESHRMFHVLLADLTHPAARKLWHPASTSGCQAVSEENRARNPPSAVAQFRWSTSCVSWTEKEKLPLSSAFQADARTRTGDPFITSYGQLSRRAIASHFRPLCSAESTD
jgi:hypothetical protein